ncbi:hypothetical protein [Roseburia sp. 831b]|uniref:hypothetical protein n=1 Tax=Roseburia sp. 831b TaxID=1261635 RepID=UPI0009524861|nr:hypothetical protein [Roseburia sp. 831b]WVK73201.1 hypothetical protein BIV16_01390 [Roseburia sp. 831b]
MKRKNIFGIVMGIIVVICILMAMVQFKKERITQKDNVTVLPGGVTIKKIEDDEEYDISKNYYKDYDDTGLETYVITAVFDYDSETEYIKEIRDADICEYIYKNGDGNAEIKVTGKQRKKWLEGAKKNIDNVLERMEKEDMCNFMVDEDYERLTVKMTKQYSPQTFYEDVKSVLYNEEIVQVFSGVEDWSVHFIVENMNTGYELVNVQYPQEGWNIDEDTWDE